MIETIVFGGGCFWCTEAVFAGLKGVLSVVPGYAGGAREHPNYASVSTGTTNHAEVVKVEFDPNIISLEVLLDVFWNTHDPTSLNKQGADVGSQYRSVIFYTSESQKKKALSSLESIRSAYDKPIVTQIVPLDKFYDAESDHKNYYEKNSTEPYCQLVISPKLKHLRQRYREFLKS